MKLRLFCLLACFYMLIASREPPWGDAHVVYETAQNLVERGTLSVNLGGPPQFYAIRNGKKYGVFPLGNVIAMAPSYLAYRAIHALPHPPFVDELLFRFMCHLSTSLLGAGVCVLFFAMARRQGASERSAVFLSLLLAMGTIMLVYARAPYSEALQTLAITWTVERGLTLGEKLSTRGGLFLGLACGLLFNTKLVYAAAIPVVPIYIILRNRGRWEALFRCLAAAAFPLLALIAVALAHNYLKTGKLSDTGYAIPGGVFSGDTFAALDGFFLSTGKSIFLYSPPLVLGFLAFPTFWRRHRSRALFLLVFTGIITLTNAKFRYWHADYCWGPRLLVPLTAVWMLPAASWIDGVLSTGRIRLRGFFVGVLVGAGLWAQVLGASFYWDHYIRIAIAVKDQTGASGWYTEDLHHCHFIPQFSPLLGHAWMLRHVAHEDPDVMVDAPWTRVVAGKVNLAAEWPPVRLDWWLLDWIKVKEARRWLAVILMLLVGGTAASAVSLWRRLPKRKVAATPTSRIKDVGDA